MVVPLTEGFKSKYKLNVKRSCWNVAKAAESASSCMLKAITFSQYSLSIWSSNNPQRNQWYLSTVEMTRHNLWKCLQLIAHACLNGLVVFWHLLAEKFSVRAHASMREYQFYLSLSLTLRNSEALSFMYVGKKPVAFHPNSISIY